MQLLSISPETLRSIAQTPHWPPFPTRAQLRENPDLIRPEEREPVMEAATPWINPTQPWEAIPLHTFRRYYLDGDRKEWENAALFQRRRLLYTALAALVAPDDRFDETLADGVWLALEESTWSLPAHLSRPSDHQGVPDIDDPVLDLAAAEQAALLSTIAVTMPDALDAISPVIRRRIQAECEKRVLREFVENDSYWWMGLGSEAQRINNWNPWIVSNVIWTALNLPIDPVLREQVVEKALRVLEKFIEDTTEDGGCDEGPGYWTHAGASFLDCIEALHLASGKQLGQFFEVERFHALGRYMLAVFIGEGWWVNFADASAHASPNAHLIWRFAECFDDEDLRALALHIRDHQRTAARKGLARRDIGSMPRRLFELCDKPFHEIPPQALNLPGRTVLPGIEVGSIRTDKRMAVIKGGHNNESHNHNDIGHFVLFQESRPLLIDIGVETYRRETFNSRTRYTIWTMQSGWHSVPVINGHEQLPGAQFAAKAFSTVENGLQVDLAPAYPEEAGIETWKRTLLAPDQGPLEIVDSFVFRETGGEIDWVLITASPVEAVAPNRLVLKQRALPEGRLTAAGEIELDGPEAEISIESKSVTDPQLTRIWGDEVYRIHVRFHDLPQRGTIQAKIT